MSIQLIVVMVLVLGGISFFLGRQIYREFKKALKKDREEKTEKYLKAVIMEYAIVAAVCTVAAILVINYKDTGFLKFISEKLYGKTVVIPTLNPVNPFSR